jgi:hypothetical protein
MLLKAATVADYQRQSRIQVRLNRAIPGMTCPRPIEGAVAQKMVRLDELYVSTLKINPKKLPEKASYIWEIISAA